MEKFGAAYLALILPIKFLKSDYISLLKQIYKFDLKIINRIFDSAIKDNLILLNNKNRIELNQEYKKDVLNEFKTLSDSSRKYFLNMSSSVVLNYYAPTPCYEIIESYFSIVIGTSNDDIIKNIDQRIYKYLSNDRADLKLFIEVMQIYTTPFVPEKTKIKMISSLYKYNQNKLVVLLYNSLDNKDNIPFSSLLEISAAHFMISEIDIANQLLEKINNLSKEKEIKTAVKIIKLINDFESLECNKENLKQRFDNLINSIGDSPNCANLLLKIASSILSHDEAIEFMVKSKLNTNAVQIYNNIGALYLTEGYKKFIVNKKDKNYLAKAKSYLEFAKILSIEQEVYSPYLEINLLTMQFCNTFRGNAIGKKKEYKRIYKKYLALNGKADSIYFNSIVFCNCHILEKIINNGVESLYFKNYLTEILSKTSDTKIKEKIELFLNFVPSSPILPIWIITETHY